MQVGAVDDITQHVLAALSDRVSDDVRWEVGLGLAEVVVLVVDPLWRPRRVTDTVFTDMNEPGLVKV